MSMTIVDIEGPELDAFRQHVLFVADCIEAKRAFRIAVAIDDIDGACKFKVNEGIWSPPIGTLRAGAR
jgi:hypothetical protein